MKLLITKIIIFNVSTIHEQNLTYKESKGKSNIQAYLNPYSKPATEEGTRVYRGQRKKEIKSGWKKKRKDSTGRTVAGALVILVI